MTSNDRSSSPIGVDLVVIIGRMPRRERCRSMSDAELTEAMACAFSDTMCALSEAEIAESHIRLSRTLLEAARRGWTRHSGLYELDHVNG